MALVPVELTRLNGRCYTRQLMQNTVYLEGALLLGSLI